MKTLIIFAAGLMATAAAAQSTSLGTVAEPTSPAPAMGAPGDPTLSTPATDGAISSATTDAKPTKKHKKSKKGDATGGINDATMSPAPAETATAATTPPQ